MRVRSRTVATASLVCFALSGSALRANELNGAYATQQDQCRKVFERKGNRLVFTKLSDMYGSGFIVDDRQIRGKMASCNVTKRTQKDDTVNLLASCSSDIILATTHFSLKMPDDKRVVRLFPDMPGMEVTYYRCPPL